MQSEPHVDPGGPKRLVVERQRAELAPDGRPEIAGRRGERRGNAPCAVVERVRGNDLVDEPELEGASSSTTVSTRRSRLA